MTEIKFNVSKRETEQIEAIMNRFEKDCPTFDRLSFYMDLAATHANGTPLNFESLLAFPDFDFLHDCYGIIDHINRKTGQLEDCFLPRCARL